MARYTVEELSSDRFREWDDFVLGHPQGTIFHTVSWLSHVGEDPVVLTLRGGDGSVLGGVALVCRRRLGIRGFHLPPFTPYFGPLLSRSGRARRGPAEKLYLDRLRSLLAALPPAPVYDFSVAAGDGALLPYLWAGFRQSVRYTFEITGSEEEYLSEMVPTKRREVRNAAHALESGRLTVTFTRSVDGILPLLRSAAAAKRYRFDARLFERIFESADEALDWEVVSVGDGAGETLAAALMIYDLRRGYFAFNATREGAAGSKLNANTLAVHLCIRNCLARGKTFDFQGSIVPGVAYHHVQMGGRAVVRYRLQKTRSPVLYLFQAANGYRAERRLPPG